MLTIIAAASVIFGWVCAISLAKSQKVVALTHLAGLVLLMLFCAALFNAGAQWTRTP